LTFVIVAVWFSFGENKTDSDLAEDVPAKLSSLSPIQVIKDEFSKAFANFKATVPDLSTTTIDSTSTVSIPVEIIEEATSTSSGQATSSTNE
jgi:hypothetical protein